jgi:hypothetical protein
MRAVTYTSRSVPAFKIKQENHRTRNEFQERRWLRFRSRCQAGRVTVARRKLSRRLAKMAMPARPIGQQINRCGNIQRLRVTRA